MERPKRKQLRLENYDYSSGGAYFLTICTADRRRILSDVCRGDPCGRPLLALTELGRIAQSMLLQLEERYPVAVDYYVVMPDHIHAILFLTEERATVKVAPTLGQIVGAYKSLVLHGWRMICNKRNCRMGKIWQRGYYEHVIRNEQDLREVREYIEENPYRWLEKWE